MRPSDFDALPSAWRWWQPIVFGFLAGIGWKVCDWLTPIAFEMVARAGG